MSAQLMTDLSLFVLALLVGLEVISKVPATLHTPLMSGANAIHGVILLGAILVTGSTDNALGLTVGLIAIVLATGHCAVTTVLAILAVVLATMNVVSGFVVTDRMLEMFKKREPPQRDEK